jgi:hypothetical protein
VNGTPGEQGLQGVNGTPGIQGIQGLQGIQGVNGTPGIQGIQGVNGTPGEQGLQGVNGTPGIQGIQGVNGTPGEQGLQGLQGINGTNGTNALVYGNASEVLYNIGGNSSTSPCLIFNNVTGLTTACQFSTTGDMSVGNNIYRGGALNDSYIKIQAGDNYDSAGAQVLLMGKNFSTIESVKGDIIIRVPNLTTDGFHTVMYIDNNINKPIISFENNNLSNVGTPQVSTDAATKGYVDSASGGWDGTGAFFQNTTRPITGSEINRSVKNDYLAIDGGLGSTAGGATGGHFTVTGTDYSAFPGGLMFFVPNGANSAYKTVMQIRGSTNTPYLNMLNNSILQARNIGGAESAGSKLWF